MLKPSGATCLNQCVVDHTDGGYLSSLHGDQILVDVHVYDAHPIRFDEVFESARQGANCVRPVPH